MRTFPDCVACFVRQTMDVLEIIDAPEPVRERVIRRVLLELHQADFNHSPPSLARRIHRIIREMCECPDPYRQIKNECNALASELYPDLWKAVLASPDPLASAVRLAIAGNVIDFGVQSHSPLEGLRDVIYEAMETPVHPEGIDRLRRQAAEAERILYLGDNAGEIVLDKLLLEQLPPGRVTYVVRGGPIINDALRSDAEELGIAELAEVVDNGDDAPGTLLEHCTPELRRRFDQADLVIAKGQGNFETLNDVREKPDLLFLFRLKCDMVCRALQQEKGLPMVLWRDELDALDGGTLRAISACD